MEKVNVGKNTSKTELKIPAEVKKAFKEYPKHLAVLGEAEEMTMEEVMVAWLAEFANSETYKEAEDKAVAEKKRLKEEKDAEIERKKQERIEAKNKKKRDRLEKARLEYEEAQADVEAIEE